MPNNLPLVTVIIPVYNHEQFVAQALNSVLKQTYPNIELIIIDDGSKDKSGSIIEKCIDRWSLDHSPERKITFIKQTNQGAHATINRGLTLAQGDFLTILNSDDYYALNRMEVLVNQLQQQKAEWAFTGVHGIDQGGEFLPLDHYWKVWYERNVWNSCLQLTIGFQLLIDNIAVSTGNLFFSRFLFEKVGEFKDLKLAHDLDFALRAVLVSEPLFIQDKLYFYRMHDSNTLHQVNHLLEKEKKQIYQNYLVEISQKPPLNKSAPCHWYWPVAFAKARNDLFMDRGFFDELIDSKVTSKPDIKSQVTEKPLSSHSNSSQKITLITHSLCLSGAPKVVLDFAILFKKLGHTINVISLCDGPLRNEFTTLGIDVYVIPDHHKYWLVPTRRQKVIKLLRLMPSLYFRAKNTVICNCAVSWPILFPLVLSSPFKKFFWFIHDSFSPSCMIEPGLGMRMFRRLKNKTNLKTWFGSDSTRKIWEEGIQGIVKYWSGFPKQIICPSPKKRIKKLLSIGSVTPRKAHHYLLEAFIECIEENRIPEDVTLTIVGFTESKEDTYLYELLIKKNRSHLKNRIFFVKNLEAFELQTFYEEADLYIQSSVVECLPLSLLQAMSMGLPIITTDVNGCTEAIQHQETGYVCASRNSKELAYTIVEAIDNPEQSYQFGKNALQKFNEIFCLEKNQEDILREI